MSNPITFYVTGGTLRSDAPSYVERQADRDLYEGLSQGEYCYVLNTRQMGKSSLMVRTASRFRESGARVAVLDLTAVGQNLSPEQWYEGLLVSLGQQLRLEDDLDDFWLGHDRLGPLQRWMEALHQVVLPRLGEGGRLVLFIDEIDAVRSLPFSTDEFFAGVRECYNRRTRDPLFERVSFCLLGVATPSDLISDTRMSPFNVGRRIRITDFTPEEAAPLAAGIKGGADVLKRVLYWTGGQPYMTQRLCRAAAEDPELIRPVDVDRLCGELFLSRQARESDDHLAFVRNRLLKSEVDLAALLDLYQQVRAGRSIPDDETDPLCAVLKLSGVCREAQGRLRVRNPVYGRVFDHEWVQAHMPGAELRRQREAYRRGLVRASAIAAAVVVGMTGLAAWGFSSADQARRARDLADGRLITANRERLKSDRLANSLARTNTQLKTAVADANGQRTRAEAEQRKAGAAARAERIQKLAALASRAEAVKQGREAVAQRNRSHQLLVRSYIARAEQAVDSGDPVAALPWYAETARLDQQDPVRAAHHRMRLASTISSAPALLQLLPFGPAGNAATPVWAPGGRRIALVSPEGREVRLCDPATGRSLGPTLRLRGQFNTVMFSGDGSKLLTGGSNPDGFGSGEPWSSEARVWDAATGRPLSPVIDAGSPIQGAALSGDGRWVVTSTTGEVRLWHAVTGKARMVPIQAAAGRRPLAVFSPDGSRLLVWDGAVLRKWDPSAGSPTGNPLVLPEAVAGLTTSQLRWAGRRIVALHEAGVTSWDDASGKVLSHLPLPALRGMAELSACGRYLKSSHYTKGIVRIFDIRTGILTGPLRHPAGVLQADVSEDGTRVATACDDGKVRVWSLPEGTPLQPPVQHTGGAWYAAWDPTGERLATAGFDGLIKIWDAAPPVPTAAVFLHAGPVRSAAFIHGGKRVLTLSADGLLAAWDLRTGKAAWQRSVPITPMSSGPRLLLDSAGECFLVANAHQAPRIFSLREGAALTPPLEHPGLVRNGVFSADGRRLFTVCEAPKSTPVKLRYQLRAWDNRTGKLLSVMSGAGPLERVEFSPDHQHALAVAPGGLGRLFDLRNQQFAGAAFPAKATRYAFSPDGRWLAAVNKSDSSGRNQQSTANWLIQTRDVRSGRIVAPEIPVTAHVFEVAISPGGRRLAAACADGTARIWELATGKPSAVPLRHPGGWALQVAFSSDGRLLLTSGGAVANRGELRVWNAETGEAVTPMLRHHSTVRGVAFSPDGRRVVSASADGSARVWDLQPGALSLADLLPRAQLIGGQRVDQTGGAVALSPNAARKLLVGSDASRRAPSLARPGSALRVSSLFPLAQALPPQSGAPIRSRGGSSASTLHFTNHTSWDAKLFWVDFEGIRRPYGVLDPGTPRTMSTFEGHVWVVTAEGQPDRYFVGGRKPSQVLLMDRPYEEAPGRTSRRSPEARSIRYSTGAVRLQRGIPALRQ